MTAGHIQWNQLEYTTCLLWYNVQLDSFQQWNKLTVPTCLQWSIIIYRWFNSKIPLWIRLNGTLVSRLAHSLLYTVNPYFTDTNAVQTSVLLPLTTLLNISGATHKRCHRLTVIQKTGDVNRNGITIQWEAGSSFLRRGVVRDLQNGVFSYMVFTAVLLLTKLEVWGTKIPHSVNRRTQTTG